MSKISLKHSGGNVVSLNSPDSAPAASDVAFKLPNQDGNASEALITDGSGNLSFSAVGGGAGKARNLIINGAVIVAQKSASSTTNNGYETVDRFSKYTSSTDETPSQEQVDVASGTTPYTLGFRKAYKITNGNQTSGGSTTTRVGIEYKIEAQDLATSGWNYLSSTSYITFSYWVKSSVAQNFYNTFGTDDGTSQRYVTETGSLSADTWTKITKTIPGNSNLTFNNDNGEGLEITWECFRGTSQTGTRPLNAWAAADNNTRTPDQTSTWYTTNDATFEITGVQLEVGDEATDFAHESFDETLSKCQRYLFIYGFSEHNSSGDIEINFIPADMRALPTVTRLGNVMFGGESSTAVTAIYNNAGFSVNNQPGSNLILRCINSSDANCGGCYSLSAEL